MCSYREAMASFATMGPLATWYSRLDTDDLRETLGRRSKKAPGSLDKNVAKARSRTSLQAVSKLTERVDGSLRFRLDAPHRGAAPVDGRRPAAEGLAEAVRANFDDYRSSLPDHVRFLLDRFELVDIAHKVVGVGSVGTRAFIVLLESEVEDPLVLQFKEAGASVLEPYLGASPYAHPGRAGGRGTADDAGGERPLPRMEPVDDRRSWLLLAPAARHEGLGRARRNEPPGLRRLRPHVRMVAGPGSCPFRARPRPSPPTWGRATRWTRPFVRFAARYASLNEADFRRHAEAIADGEVPCQAEQ